jgi:translation initiation factor IF-3
LCYHLPTFQVFHFQEEVRIKRRRSKPSTDARAKYRINHQIRVPEVRLIGPDDNHIGIVPLSEALTIAHDSELDLVEISPAADPPVARVMDYGKFLYQQQKRDRDSRKSQKQIEVKEIQLRPKTTEHHKSFKVRDAHRWLEEGKKVKVRVCVRGREITYPEIAIEQLAEIAEELSDVGAVEQQPDREGRTMLMILAPVGKKGAQKEEEEKEEEEE